MAQRARPPSLAPFPISSAIGSPLSGGLVGPHAFACGMYGRGSSAFTRVCGALCLAPTK